MAQSLEEIWNEGQQALGRGDAETAFQLFVRCCNADPLVPAFWHARGMAAYKSEQHDRAIAAFKTWLTLQPGSLMALLYLGGAARRAGDRALAADCLSLAVQGANQVHLDQMCAHGDPELKAIITEAPAFLEAFLRDLAAAAGPLDGNLKGACWRFHETAEPQWRAADQRPERLYLPALDPQPWFERGDLSWVPSVEAAFDAIKAEVEAALDPADGAPYIGSHMASAAKWHALAGNESWSAVHLYNGGIANDALVAKFPQTLQALEGMPLCRKGDQPVEIFFSLLKPGTHIVPHFGLSNSRLTVHLPLVVPEGDGACWLRAGSEKRIMQEGQVIAFDDSFDHEAKNDGDSLRVNLIVEAWHPALTEAEQQQLARMSDDYDAWFAGRSKRLDFVGTDYASAVQAAQLFTQAELALRERAPEAGPMLEQVLSINPRHKRALKILADMAFGADANEKGLGYLRAFAAEVPDHAETQYRLGVIEEQIGTDQGAIDAYGRCLRADPGNLLAYLYAGYAYQAAGDAETAAQLYSLGCDIDARVTRLAGDASFDEATRERSAAARSLLDAKIAALHASAMDPDAGRVTGGVWIQNHQGQPPYEAAAQQPHEFYIPGLKPLTFLERADMPWAGEIEAAYNDIKAELMAAMPAADDVGRPYLDTKGAMDPSFDRIKNSMNWTALDLFRDGVENTELTSRFPKTLAALKAAPLMAVADKPFEVFFSLLKPHQHIPPHFGLSNHGATIHLPLIVPDDCRIRVADEWREWREGEIIAFDDSFDHEARNDSDDLRVVLIFEVWHPDLTTGEVAAVRRSFQKRSEWFKARAIPAE